MASETRPRDVQDVVRAIYEFGMESVTTRELREVIGWIRCELDNRRAASPHPEGGDRQ